MATLFSRRRESAASRIRVALSIAATLLAAGCGKTPSQIEPQPFPVRGKVTYKQQPAKGFRVVFNAASEQGSLHFAPSAMTDDNGEFRLRSYKADDGAPAGDYTVTFQWPKRVATGDPYDGAPEVDQLKGQFNNPQASRFHVTVHEGENALEPFELR